MNWDLTSRFIEIGALIFWAGFQWATVQGLEKSVEGLKGQLNALQSQLLEHRSRVEDFWLAQLKSNK